MGMNSRVQKRLYTHQFPSINRVGIDSKAHKIIVQ